MDFFRQSEGALFTCSQCDGAFEWVSVGSTLHFSGYHIVAVIRQFGGNGEPRFVERLAINP